MDLIARSVVEGLVSGLHQSPYHGFSVEFAEHREYSFGDDLKHLDWKVLARTDRYYIKEYEEETNLKAMLAVDMSESMHYSSDRHPTKFQVGCTAAASLAYLMLRQRDSVGMILFDQQVQKIVPPSGHPAHMKVLLDEFRAARPEKKTDMDALFLSISEHMKRRGLVLIVSDFFVDTDRLVRGLKRLHHKRHEVILFHVMDPAEIEFPFREHMLFKGLEGLGELLVDPKGLAKAYRRKVGEYLARIAKECRNLRIDHVLINTADPLDTILARYLSMRLGR